MDKIDGGSKTNKNIGLGEEFTGPKKIQLKAMEQTEVNDPNDPNKVKIPESNANETDVTA